MYITLCQVLFKGDEESAIVVLEVIAGHHPFLIIKFLCRLWDVMINYLVFVVCKP